MAFDLIAKDSSLVNTSASRSARLNNRLDFSTPSTNKNNHALLDEYTSERAKQFTEVDWENALSTNKKRKEAFLDMYNNFYTSGTYMDTSGKVKTANALEAADRYEFSEYLHELFPMFSTQYFYDNAESFMKEATGIETDVKSYSDHLGKIWNASWANFADGWNTFFNYVGYGISGQFGTQAWENKKEELANNRKTSAANYRKDLGDEVYDNLFQKMLSGTTEQAPQMAMMLAQMALTVGTGGISGFLASKELIKHSSAVLASKIGKGTSTAINFLISGIMDAGSVMADCTEYGFSDATATFAGLAVGAFTGLLETWGDDTLLKPLNDMTERLLDISDDQVMHRAVKDFKERLKDSAFKSVKHVLASEVTEPAEEEFEYVAELLVKCIANEYEIAKGGGVAWEEIGASREQIEANLKETLIQTMLSTPLMTFGGLVVSSGFDAIAGDAAAQRAPKKYQVREGATHVTSTKNFVLSSIKTDASIQNAANGKANPINIVRVGDYVFADGPVSLKQEEAIRKSTAIYTIDKGSMLTTKSKPELEASAIKTNITLDEKTADEYLAATYQSGKLEAYGYASKDDILTKVKNSLKETTTPLMESNDGTANALYLEIKGKDDPIKINIGEKNSSAGTLADLEDITGVKYRAFETDTMKAQRDKERADAILKKEEAKAKEKEAKEKAKNKSNTTSTNTTQPTTTPTPQATSQTSATPQATPTTPTTQANTTPQPTQSAQVATPQQVNGPTPQAATSTPTVAPASTATTQATPAKTLKVKNEDILNYKKFEKSHKPKAYESYELYDSNKALTTDFANAKYAKLTDKNGKSIVVNIGDIKNENFKKSVFKNVKTSPFKAEADQVDVYVAKEKHNDIKNAQAIVNITPDPVQEVVTKGQEVQRTQKAEVAPIDTGELSDSEGKEWKALGFCSDDDISAEKKKHGNLLKTEKDHETKIYYYEDGTAIMVEDITREQYAKLKEEIENKNKTAETTTPTAEEAKPAVQEEAKPDAQEDERLEPLKENGIYLSDSGKEYQILLFGTDDDLSSWKEELGDFERKTDTVMRGQLDLYSNGYAVQYYKGTREQYNEDTTYIYPDQKPSTTAEAKPAETTTPITEGEAVVKADEIAKEKNVSNSEATETVVMAAGTQNAAEQITNEPVSFDKLADTLSDEYVKNVIGKKKKLESKMKAVADAISTLDGAINIYRQIYGDNAEINDTTKKEFSKLFVDYINGEAVEINDSVRVFFDTLKQGVLASYLVNESTLQGDEKNELNKLKDKNDKKEEQTSKDKLNELKENEQKKVEQEKKDAKTEQSEEVKPEAKSDEKPADADEELSTEEKQKKYEELEKIAKNNPVIGVAYSLAAQAEDVFAYIARAKTIKGEPQKRIDFYANKKIIYSDWLERLKENPTVNVAYEFLASTDASELIRYENGVYSVKSDTAKDGREKRRFSFRDREKILADYIATYYNEERAKEVVTKQDLQALSISPYLLNKMRTALRDGTENYFRDIIYNDISRRILIGTRPRGKDPLWPHVISQLREINSETGETLTQAMDNIKQKLSGLDMSDFKARDLALMNDEIGIKKDFINVISSLLLNDFLKTYPDAEKYNNMEDVVQKTNERWKGMASQLTNVLSEMSIYRALQLEDAQIEKASQDIVDKIRQQRKKIDSDEMLSKTVTYYVDEGAQSGQLNMEANPSKHIKLLEGYRSGSEEQMHEFAESIKTAMSDENGRDIIDRELGLETADINGTSYNYGIGIYNDGSEVQKSVGQQNVVKIHLDENGDLSAEDMKKLEVSALLHGIFLRQDSVSYGYVKESKDISNCVVLDIGRNLTMDEQTELAKLLDNGDFGQISTPTGVMIANFAVWNNPPISNEEFNKKVDAVLDVLGNKWKDNFTTAYATYEGDLISTGLADEKWNEEKGIHAYPSTKLDGELEREVYRKSYNEFAERLQSVYEEYAEKYDWGNPYRIPTVEEVNGEGLTSQRSTALLQEQTTRASTVLSPSPFGYDNNTGKYFVGQDVYNEVVEVLSKSYERRTEEIDTEIRKTATLATAFLTSLSEDTQDLLVRKATASGGTKFLTGGNQNLLRLFFNANELKDTSLYDSHTRGLSLTNSAKIILGINSNESTVRHEGTHIIWWADPEFRNRAINEYKNYFAKDSEGKEIRAVVEANLDRFGGYTADQIIEGLRNLTRDDYDYTSDTFLSSEEAIAYMGEMHWEGLDKIEYSEGLRGLFERLARILKEAFEKLKNFFNTDLLVETNNKIYAPLFENETEARAYYEALKAQEMADIIVPQRANTRTLTLSTDGNTNVFGIEDKVSERVRWEKMADVVQGAYENSQLRDDVQAKTQYETLVYRHVKEDDKKSKLVSNWKKSIGDGFVTEENIGLLKQQIENSGLFSVIDGISPDLVDEIKDDIAHRLAYETEDYMSYASMIGKLRDGLKDKKGEYRAADSKEVNEALYQLYGYRQIETTDQNGNKTTSTIPVGIMSKIFANDAKNSWNDIARTIIASQFTLAKEGSGITLDKQDVQTFLSKSEWYKPSKKSGMNTIKVDDNTKLNFKLEEKGLSVEKLDAFLSLMIKEENGKYVPNAWKNSGDKVYDTDIENFGDSHVLQGPLVDLLNYAHKDEDQVKFTTKPTSIANDQYITAAYNTFNASLPKDGKLDLYLLDSVSKDYLGAIEQLDRTILKNIYGSEMSAEFYESLQTAANSKVQEKIDSLKSFQEKANLFEGITSTDALVGVIDRITREMGTITKTKVIDGASGLTALEIHNLIQQKEALEKTVESLKQQTKDYKNSDEYKSGKKAIKERDAALEKVKEVIYKYQQRKDRILEQVANILTSMGKVNLSDPDLTAEAKAVLTSVNGMIKGLNKEVKELQRENTKIKAELDTTNARLQGELNIAQGLVKDFNNAGVLPLFDNQIKELRRVARETGTADVSQKLTSLLDYLAPTIAKGAERFMDRKLTDFDEIYTSDKSANYDKYRENAKALETWLNQHMLARPQNNHENIAQVTRTIRQLNAGELVQLTELIGQVAKDSMKFYNEQTVAEREYHEEWHKNIAKEIHQLAIEKGVDIYELSEADSVGASSAKSISAAKVGSLLKDFVVMSVQYRDRFPTLYAYIFGGVDHQGHVYEGLNGAMNAVDKGFKAKNDRMKKSLIDNFSNSIFFPKTLTEKNLAVNMSSLKSKFRTELGEDTFTDADMQATGYKISQYDQLGRKKTTVYVDESNDSAMREVARWYGKKQIKIAKAQEKLDSTREKIQKKEVQIENRKRFIYNTQVAIENTLKMNSTLGEQHKKERIAQLQADIKATERLLERDYEVQENRREKIDILEARIKRFEQETGDRPNQNIAKYSTQELLAIYMYARQEGGIDRLVYSPSVYTADGEAVPNSSRTNNLSIGNIIWVINQVEKNQDWAPLKHFADDMTAIATENFEKIRDVKYYLSNGNTWLESIDNYFAFASDSDNLYEYGADIDTGLMKKSGEMSEAEIKNLAREAKANDKMTLERTTNNNALNLKIMDRMPNAIYRQEYYANMAIPIYELKNLLNDETFQSSMREYYGRNDGNKELVALSNYVNALGNSQRNVSAGAIDEVVRFLTNNTAATAMAFRATTVLQQIPTMIYFLKDPHIGLKGLVSAMWRAATDRSVYDYSVQMQERANSSLQSIRQSKNLGTWLAQSERFRNAGLTLEKVITKSQNTGLWLLEKTDAYIANAMWYAAYEGIVQENMEKGLDKTLSESDFRTLCANEATQRVMDISPVQTAKDNAAIYSNKNAWLRQTLLFTNQTTKMLNGIVGAFRDLDIKGVTYLAKVLGISIMTFVLNGLITGQLVRKTGGGDDDDEEAKVHLLRNIFYTIYQGSTDLIPLLSNVIGEETYGDTNLKSDITNLFKVIGKDEEDRSEHQLANAWSYLITDIMSGAGFAGNEARSVYRAFREKNVAYAYNTKWGEFFDK